MKVTSKNVNAFAPLTVEILVESEDELIALRAMSNIRLSTLVESNNIGVVSQCKFEQVARDTITGMFNTFNDICKKRGLKT